MSTEYSTCCGVIYDRHNCFDIWLHDLFQTKSVQQGGVIRRKRRDVERFAEMDLFMAEIHRRGFQVVENSGQIVIFCNRAPIRRLTHPPVAQS